MAYFDTTWYLNFGDGSTTGYYAVAKRPQNAAVAAGQIVRQFTTPSVGNEKCFICIVAGTTANTTDATWGTTTRGQSTTDGTAQWRECTGAAALNGDLTNTPSWTTVKGLAVSIAQIIKRNNGASYQMCTVFGTAGSGSEPSFSDTAGVTTADGGVTWTCLGPVSNFTGGQAPHARLSSAFNTIWFISGNTIYVGDNHAETQSTAITWSPASALLAKILCHDHSGSYPPASSDITTGAVITASALGGIAFSGQGSFYFYGIEFKAGGAPTIGAGSVGQTQNWYYYDNCSIQANGTSSMTIGASSTAWGIVIFNNTTVRFASTATRIVPYFLKLIWQNTGQVLAAGSSVPTTLFQFPNASGLFNEIVLRNLDLSQLTGSLWSNANTSIGTLTVQDCKLNAAMTVTRPINSGMQVQLIRSDSAATAYKSSRITYEGTESTETAIVRTGGAVDPTSQAQSRKIITTADAQWLRPFMAEPYAIYNETVGSAVDVTVYGTVNTGSLPNNDDIWAEFEYLSDAASPIGTIVTTTKSNVLASNAAVASDSSGWVVPATTLELATATAVTLSGGDLVATNTGTTSSDQGARVPAAAGKTTGKYYFEGTFTAYGASAGTRTGFGIGTTTSAYVDVSLNSINGAFCSSGGAVGANGVANVVDILPSAVFAAGETCAVAVDLDNRKIWFRRAPSDNWNNSATANPATNAEGIAILPPGAMVPFCCFGGTGCVSGNVLTANFGASAFVGAVPSGFTSGWPYGGAHFKLATTITPQLPGYIHARVRVGKASATYYVDPKPVLT